VFVAFLALDTRRVEQRRLDCLPCLRVPYLDANGHWVFDALDSEDEADANLGQSSWDEEPDAYFAPQPLLGGEREGGGGGGRRRGGAGRRPAGIHGALHEQRVSLGGLVQAYMEKVHAPLLMNPLVQAVVVGVFVTGGAWRRTGRRRRRAARARTRDFLHPQQPAPRLGSPPASRF
jgi:Niemann-Pick C1 protein